MSCFNPLHCGAVVASRPPYGGRGRKQPVSIPFIAGQWSLLQLWTRSAPSGLVSIPFIAGQWSLQNQIETLVRLRSGFNPLHCGAVVASWTPWPATGPKRNVSIPFIAGQWSLLAWGSRVSVAPNKFQSPSLRGSGRFFSSSSALLGGPHVSIPFIAGQWSLLLGLVGVSILPTPVSIPFIAGQWSLPLPPCHTAGGPTLFQSPSLRGSGRFTPPASAEWRMRVRGFNPLHCGAVVASAPEAHRDGARRRVSIPFIAGQWSLPALRRVRRTPRRVSIPFIAGQWSLPYGC